MNKCEEGWVIKDTTWGSGSTFRNRTRFVLPELDRHLRCLIPALFSEIKIMPDKIIVEVPCRAAPRIVQSLRGCYYIDVPLKVIGV